MPTGAAFAPTYTYDPYAVPPPPTSTSGTLPMADQSMYAAPIQAQYQPGGTSYEPPYDPGAQYGAATGATAYQYAPAPAPTDAYNSAPPGAYPSTPLPAPPPPNYAAAEPYGTGPHAINAGGDFNTLRSQSAYSPPPLATRIEPSANTLTNNPLATTPRVGEANADPARPPQAPSLDRNTAGLDKPFTPPVLSTFDKKPSVVGAWQGGKYVSPAESQATFDQIASTGQPIGDSTGPLETLANTVGGGLSALGTGIANFFAPPPTGAEGTPPREITGAPDPSLAAAPPTVTSLPSFKSPGYAAQQNQGASSGNPWGQMMGDLVSNISGNWDPSFSLEPGASPEAYGRYGQMAFDDAQNARRTGYLQHANFRTADSSQPSPTFGGGWDPWGTAYEGRTVAGQPITGPPRDTASRQEKGTTPSLFDRARDSFGTELAITRDGLDKGAGFIVGAITGEPNDQGIATALGAPQGVGAQEVAASTPKKTSPTSASKPTGLRAEAFGQPAGAFMTPEARSMFRDFYSNGIIGTDGRFSTQTVGLLKEKGYVDDAGNWTEAAAGDPTLPIKPEAVGTTARWHHYQRAGGTPAGVTESTASETPAAAAPVETANSGSSSNSGGNSSNYGNRSSGGGRSYGGSSGGYSGGGGYSRRSRSFGDNDEPSSRWQDYLDDEDGDGQFSAAEIKRAKFRMKQAQKRRGKKGRLGKGKTTMPSFPDSPQRQLVLGNLSSAFDEAFANFPKPR